MQNTSRSNLNYDQNIWYTQMYGTEIKTEPVTIPTPTTPQAHLEHYLKQQQQQHLNSAMNTSAVMTPSPNNDNSVQHFFDASMQQKIYQQQQLQCYQQQQQQQQQQQYLQQQQYQQQFQYAQQSSAIQNHLPTTMLPSRFNLLTPPDLPPVTVIHNTRKNKCNGSEKCEKTCNKQRKLIINATTLTARVLYENNYLQSPKRKGAHHVHSPGKSGKCCSSKEHESDHQQEELSLSSDDYIYLPDNDKYMDFIFKERINSHGKLILNNCKTCHEKFDTKAKLWIHMEGHLKPEKALRCPCPGCPFVTDLKHFLRFHIRKHTHEKPHICPEPGCVYRCETKGSLTSHLKSHSKVYRYHCADCDYAVKFLHSFKQHLKKHGHRPGKIFDENGKEIIGMVIDIYGKRRGPKNNRLKGNIITKKKKTQTSQLSAALRGIKMSQQNNDLQQQEQSQQQSQEKEQQQQAQSPEFVLNENSTQLSVNNDMPPTAKHQGNDSPPNYILNNFQQQPPQDFPNLLTPNLVKAFIPYFNIQMLAAQQQFLAQLSPVKREEIMQQLQVQYEQQQCLQQQVENEQQQQTQEPQQQQQQLFQNFIHLANSDDANDDHDEEDEAEDDEHRRSVDSAMDLSQPANSERQTPEADEAINLKIKQNNDAAETPVAGLANKRKGRILQLDELLEAQKISQEELAENQLNNMIAASVDKLKERLNFEEHAAVNVNTTTSSSTSNDSGTVTSNESSDSEPATDLKSAKLFECKHCDIIFKDPVLYYLHMGYHSCDDPFKCNMCGVKSDGPVQFLMHMACNAHK